MGKYLFYDIDGTLMGPSRKVTEKTKWAIEEAKRQGHRAFLCTGRAPTSISDDLKEIDFDGIVCSAGGFVIVNGEFIYESVYFIRSDDIIYKQSYFVYIGNEKSTLSDTRC